MKQPNFFIVGAPKCGTTALSAYLSEHPNIFFCSPKEPHYFADDLAGHRPVSEIDAYLRLFSDAGPEHLAVGEGSVFYLYSSTALKNIHQFCPTAKIIVMQRNPVDLVQSLHQQYLHGLYEDEADFAKAWELQEQRRQGKNIPRLCRQPELLMYGDLGKLGAQMNRLYSIFPESQIKLIKFDDFASSTSTVYRDVLEFLDIPDDGRRAFPPVNEAQGFRSPIAYHVARNTPAALRNLLSRLRFSRKFQTIPKMADRIFKTPAKKKPLSERFRRQLEDYFSADLELLNQLTMKHSNSR